MPYNFLNETLKLSYFIKALPTKGLLVYEYNPFRNLRISENTEIEGVLYKKGTLVDFDTDLLQFSLNNPVNILPLYSYDGSVNLILNDGKTHPKLINSRFSALGRNEYLIVDRYGDNDTNIYDIGSLFDLDTSLYKRVVSIPELNFLGVTNGGNLPVGNYHFYFKYLDADGNATDFIAESGLVSVFIGTTPNGIKSGFRNENSNKSVNFYLSNIDTTYPYVEVYYTRATSDIRLNYIKEAYKINKKFLVNNALICNLTITGFEETEAIPLSDLNIQYNIVDSVYTQAACLNMLFLGNVHKPSINYKELQDLALHLVAYPKWEKYNTELKEDYSIQSIENTYYSPTFIYNYTGYWPRELYRLGIVFVMNDNSLSPVFNIRGALQIENVENVENVEYTKYTIYNENGERTYIPIDEFDYLLQQLNSKGVIYENSKGVVSFNAKNDENGIDILGINVKLCTAEVKDDTGKDVSKELFIKLLKSLNVKAFFITRQTRIPNILCQGLSMATDIQSNTPVIAAKDGILSQINDYNEGEVKYIAERFLDDNQKITHNFVDRLSLLEKSYTRINTLLCPEYDVNLEYLNSFFTGDTLYIQKSDFLPKNNWFDSDSFNTRHLYQTINNYKNINDNTIESTKIVGVPDNTKLVVLEGNKFSTRAGEAEEVLRFEFIKYENKVNKATNLLRGSFGSYLGISKNLKETNQLFDIRITNIPLKEQLNIRALDSSTFYSVSNRHSLELLKEGLNVYEGDCYICLFTHRINRNFNDPSAPYNDEIVDPDTWKNNLKYDHEILVADNISKINLGDVNAVLMGIWVTFHVRSSINLNIRSTDDSYTEEVIMCGHSRGFYPLQAINASGTYKVPEAACHNKGLAVSVNERWYSVMPNVPAIKNDFTNRIMYSDIHINDAFKNGFRVFKANNYRDYPKTYGQITKLIELGGNLLCVFEHGVALIAVNERTIAGHGAGGNVFINTSNVLPENPKIISDMYGSLWPESIIKTPNFVYGVDTVAKKIWKTDGNGLICISDLRVLEFLNNNITLGERELTPIIGIRNVKSFYNAFKQDVMFTFYDNTYGFEEKVWNLCWNERMDMFITFYSWVPSVMENIDNIPFSFDRNTSKWMAKLGVSHTNNSFADGITLSNVIVTNSENGNSYGDYMYNTNNYLFEYTYLNKKEEFVTKTYTISESSRRKLVGILSISNRIVPNSFYTVDYSLQRDLNLNYLNFEIVKIDVKGENISGGIILPSDAKYSGQEVPIYALKFKDGTDLYMEVRYADEKGLFNYDLIAKKREYGNNYSSVYYFKNLYNPITLLSELYYRNSAGHVYSDVDEYKIGINQISGQFKPITLVTIDNLYTLDPGTEVGVYSGSYFTKCTHFSGGTIQGLIDSLENRDGKWYAHGVPLENHWTVVSTSINVGLPIFKDLSGKRLMLPKEQQVNPDKIVTLLNIRAEISVLLENVLPELKELNSAVYKDYQANYKYGNLVNAGYYESTIAIAPLWNLLFLSTDFWKHGQAGLIDITDDIKPTMWYGKQHPFEFECVVVNDPSTHKIFSNLELTANKAKPESFHYEIIGECYDFTKDKVNMYFRLEAMKALWLYNGVDVCYDKNFLKVAPKQLNKSADLIHTYYSRLNTINDVEDYYVSSTYPKGYDYRHLSGAEIIYYPNRQEYRIWQHSPAVDIDNSLSEVTSTNSGCRGLIAGNMTYLEDRWKVTINPILICYKNEYTRNGNNFFSNSTWVESKRGDKLPPFAIYNSPIPNKVLQEGKIDFPTSSKDNDLYDLYDNFPIDLTNWLNDISIYRTSFGDSQNRKEIDLKDRFMKVRIRYSGDELAVIDFLRTVYRLSFS